MMQVTIEFALNPGMEAEFEKAVALMDERVKAYDGFLGEQACRSLDDDGRFITLFAGVTGRPSRNGMTTPFTSRSSNWAETRSLPGTASAWPRSSGNTATTPDLHAPIDASQRRMRAD